MEDQALNGTVFTLTQALQLVGAAPCLFVVVFLCGMMRRNAQAVIPALYFMSLACGFMLPLLALYPSASPIFKVVLSFGDGLLVAFSFLLICQFLQNRVPPFSYWLVLILPLLGNMLPYARLVCGPFCYDTATLCIFYHLFSSAFIFLLLIIYASRASGMQQADPYKKHKYWLIIALIALHLLGLFIDLAQIAGRMSATDAQFAATALRLTFIYLVLTSLFRVFYPTLASQIIVPGRSAKSDPALDAPYLEKIRQVLETERVYRNMGFNRAALAQKVGVSEHQLSRMINHHFQMNFNELINRYRIEEAKQRLLGEPEQQITVIGFEVGFNSIASFNRVFKDKTGMSPTEFRLGKS